MAFEITWEPRGVVRTFSGTLTAAEFIRSIEAVHNDWRFDNLYYSINDFLAVTDIDVSELTAETAAARAIGASMSNPRLLMAVISRDARILSLAGTFLKPRYRSYPLQVFDDMTRARAWIEKVHGQNLS